MVTPQINPLNKSLLSEKPLNPNWVTGFTDAEGSFISSVYKRKGAKGYTVRPLFEIGLHSKDVAILYKIKEFFGCGNVNIRQNREAASFSVTSISDLKTKIIPHFKKYSLLTQKKVDFNLWVKIVNLIENKEHLTIEGVNKILELKSALNRGLSKSTAELTNVKALDRPLFQVSSLKRIKPMWLSGFTDGDGSFSIKLTTRKNNKIQVEFHFRLTQHIRDAYLLRVITEYLGCGKVYIRSNGLACDLEVHNLPDNMDKIIPFFETNSLVTEKLKDFKDFTLVAELIKNRDHLTPEGLAKIIEIKSNMNMNRTK